MDGVKIKILYTIPNFNTAGSGKVLYDLAKGIDKERFEVSIACNHNKGSLFKEVQKLNIPIYLIESTVPVRPYHTLFLRLRPFKAFVKAHQFDIVHSWHWSSDWSEALAVRWLGVKWLYTKKAMGFNNAHWKIRSYLANFIITINEEMHEYFPYKKQQALIPLGIDTNYYNPERFETKRSLDPLNFNIITVANLVPVKGIEILIKALHHLDNKYIKLSIIGDINNDYGYKLKALCEELNMQSQILFVGKQLDVRPYISNSDLFVIPTLNEGRKEGMPMALVEAMAMGIPVLGSNISGINFVLKDFQELLFKASDFKDLSTKIDMLNRKTDEERLKIGSELRKYCEANFSMEVFINAHEQVYLALSK